MEVIKEIFYFFMKNPRNSFYHSFYFFKSLPSKQSPNTQLSNKLTLSPNHWANPLKFRKNSFNQQTILRPFLFSTIPPSQKPTNNSSPPSPPSFSLAEAAELAVPYSD
jgi:hypothetical protein